MQRNNRETFKLKLKTCKLKLKSWFLKWRKFNFLLYIKDFKLSTFYWLLTLMAVFVLFYSPIKQFLNLLLIDPVFSYCPHGIGVDLVFGVFLILSLIFFFRQILKHLVPSFNSILFGITIILIFVIFFNKDKSYTFYHFSSGIGESYSFASIFLLGSFLLIFSYKSYLKPLKKEPSTYSLLDDSPSLENYKDVYSRSGYASDVAKHIISTTSEVSFAVGVIGAWGSGKSDFLKRLKFSLEKNEENIVFEFNPWRVNKSDAIIGEFFKSLSKQLKPYNQSIVNTINEYSSRVLKTAGESQFKLMDALIGSWFKEDDIQDGYDTINESIKATSKRIVIFIDDVDRLTGKEVMEVLRIIRNTGNFANTFFVVGIDQDYIVSVLKKTKDFANEEEYLKKVFQLIITLPAFKKEVFTTELEKYLFTKDMDESDNRNIRHALTRLGADTSNTVSELFPSFNYESPIESMLDNIRDLKRFCNSFKIVFNILKDEADLHDLIMLELIRNKDINAYNKIRSREFLDWKMESPDKVFFDENKWAIFEKETPEIDKSSLKNAMDYLFRDATFKNQRKLVLRHNFYIYFSYQLFSLISLREFNQNLENEGNEVFTTFKRWIEEGKEKELLIIVSYLGNLKDNISLKKMAIVFLKLSKPDNNWFNAVDNLVYRNWQENHKIYFQNKEKEHKEFLCSIFNESSVSFYYRANLANIFLIGLREEGFDPNTFFFNRKELRNIIYFLFDNYLQSKKTDALITRDFYQLNDYKSENSKIVYFPPASKRFKRYLLDDDTGLKEYIITVLRPSQSPYIGQFVFDPWLEKIFIDWHIFEIRLSKTTFEEGKINRLKDIILHYLPIYFNNNRKPIRITERDDSKFIDDFLSLKPKDRR